VCMCESEREREEEKGKERVVVHLEQFETADRHEE
jgi:hypothetical protein